ncbi:hypothetical protein E2562_031420 [Oryza meyeriana var. granulata]|uniref:Uncharacterized protein n=1 Tax=Oryza meyeriana var. granulata TaxID=110450 RepID=A0A6G1BZU3_9ORYZ|nr:hypothetical protein E2562_031420 [Oryza meyeriana var. granulata]
MGNGGFGRRMVREKTGVAGGVWKAVDGSRRREGEIEKSGEMLYGLLLLEISMCLGSKAHSKPKLLGAMVGHGHG